MESSGDSHPVRFHTRYVRAGSTAQRNDLTLIVADSGATTRISSSVAQLTCLHIDQINSGSYKPAKAPTPTPLVYNATETPRSKPTESPIAPDGGLTTGAIAGIAVGSVAGIAVIAGGILFWLLRKRRARKARQHTVGDQSAVVQHEEARDPKAELPGESNRHELEGPEARELEGRDARHQLPATEEEGGKDNRQFLDGIEVQREKLNGQGPVELP